MPYRRPPLLCPCPCSGALDEERSKRRELQEAMQQVVINRAAAELEEQAAAAAAAEEVQAAQQDADMADLAAEEEEGAGGEAEEEAAPWVPRVVVLGKLHRGVSTAQRAGQVVVVRPSHLAAAQPVVVAARTPVVALPASARKAPATAAGKTPARSVAKLGFTPGPSAAKGRTPAAPGTAGKGATPAALLNGARSARKTPAVASVLKSAGGALQLPKSMLKEEPGALAMIESSLLWLAGVLCWRQFACWGARTLLGACMALPVVCKLLTCHAWPACMGFQRAFLFPLRTLDTSCVEDPRCPCAAAGDAAQPTVVLESVELPGWLFGGEAAAPEVAEAAALAAEDLGPGAQAPAALPEEEAVADAEHAAAATGTCEQQVEAEVEQAASEAAMDVDGLASPPAAAAAQQPQEAASQRRQPSQPAVDAAASDDEEEEAEEDYCHVCGKSGEPGGAH